MSRGDLKALGALTTAPARQQLEAMLEQLGPQGRKMLTQQGAEMKKRLGAVNRVVVRGDRAVAIIPAKGGKEWLTLAREGDAWKMDR